RQPSRAPARPRPGGAPGGRPRSDRTKLHADAPYKRPIRRRNASLRRASRHRAPRVAKASRLPGPARRFRKQKPRRRPARREPETTLRVARRPRGSAVETRFLLRKRVSGTKLGTRETPRLLHQKPGFSEKTGFRDTLTPRSPSQLVPRRP